MKKILNKYREIKKFIKDNITVSEKVFLLGTVFILAAFYRVNITLGILVTGACLIGLSLLIDKYLD